MTTLARPTMPRGVFRLVNSFSRAGIRFVLTGEYGSVDWKAKVRHNKQIELLVSERTFGSAVKMAQGAYPRLVMRGFLWMLWFDDVQTQQPLLQLSRPMGRLTQMYFRNCIRSAVGCCLVPSLEMALVEKYAGIIEMDPDQSRCRNDIADFCEILQRNGSDLNWRKVRRLADRLISDGGKHIRDSANDAIAGKSLRPDIQSK